MVFQKKDSAVAESYTIGYIFKRRPVKGAVGIEIEVEGKKLPKGAGSNGIPGSGSPIYRADGKTITPWVYHHDGSLRGADNAEYVLSKPIEFNEVVPALTQLWDIFRENGSSLDESNRTSVHVHLNAQQFHLNRLASITGLYFAFEEILMNFCGEHRVGNLFCLRAKDAHAIVSQIRRFIEGNATTGISEGLHYSGLNVHALTKFGSLEFRGLRGVSDPEVISQWVSLLQRLYELSAELTDPRDVCTMFSGNGPDQFLETVFGDKAALLLGGISMTETELRDSLYEGIRMAQDICYCRDWSEFNPVEIKTDPFGRSKKAGSEGFLEQAAQLFSTGTAGVPMPTLMPIMGSTWAVDHANHLAELDDGEGGTW